MSAGDGTNAVVVVVDGAVEVVVGHLVDVCPDLALVDALARLQLEAVRLGCSLRLRNPCPELRMLLDLVGLAHLIIEAPDEIGREP